MLQFCEECGEYQSAIIEVAKGVYLCEACAADLENDKNKPLPAASHLFCDDDVFQRLKAACQSSQAQPVLLMGIQLEVIEDPQERKIRAFTIAVTTGRPVLYIDDDGNFVQILGSPPLILPSQTIPHER